MKRVTFLAAVLLCVACSIEEKAVFSETESGETAVTDGQFYSGVVTVKFTEDMAALIGGDLEPGDVATKAAAVGEFAQKYGITSFKRIFKDDPRWTERHQREGLHLWYRVTFDPDAVTATKAAGDITSDPSVILAEPCRVKKINTVNDPDYYLQWHLNGQYGVNVEGAWEYTTGDPAVIVTVLDDGIVGHPDIEGNLLPGGEGMSWNFVYNSSEIIPESHAIFCGGLICCMTNNDLGVAGVAGGDYSKGKAGVTLMSCQICVDGVWSDPDEAIVYAADNGVLIASNSWGYAFGSEEDAANTATPEEDKVAIDYFNKYAGCDNNGDQLPDSKMKGGLVFFSSGNEDWAYSQPAQYEGCIAVGATVSDGTRAYYSNYGDWVDICAPGSSIWSADYFDDSFGYRYASGTSMSCPIAAGVAALAVSYYGGYGFTAEDLKTCLIEGANHDIEFDKPSGPLVDALGTLTYYTLDPPTDVSSYSVSATGDRLTFTWNVPAGNTVGTAPAYGMLLCASTDKSAIDNLDPRNVGKNVFTSPVLTEDCAVGEEVSADFFTEEFSTTFYVTCVPYNRGISYGNAAETKSVQTEENHAPTITADTDLSNVEVTAAGSLSITFTIVDPDGHDVTVSYEEGSFAESWTEEGDGEYTLSIYAGRTGSNGNFVDIGKYVATITAVDSHNAETVLEVEYTILEDNAPYVTQTLGDVILVYGSATGSSAEFNLNDYFSDPDGDDLTYSVGNSSSSTVDAVVNSETAALTLTARAIGSAMVEVIAADARRLSCSQVITVSVREENYETVSIYPNPFSDVLYVSTGVDTNTATEVVISSSTGSVVYSEVLNISAFNPAKINATPFAPGTYSVKVSYNGSETTKKVVKK